MPEEHKDLVQLQIAPQNVMITKGSKVLCVKPVPLKGLYLNHVYEVEEINAPDNTHVSLKELGIVVSGIDEGFFYGNISLGEPFLINRFKELSEEEQILVKMGYSLS